MLCSEDEQLIFQKMESNTQIISYKSYKVQYLEKSDGHNLSHLKCLYNNREIRMFRMPVENQHSLPSTNGKVKCVLFYIQCVCIYICVIYAARVV